MFPSKGKLLGSLYRNPPTFFFTNPCFVVLIHDQHFVLLSLLHASVFVTNHHRMCDTYILRYPYDLSIYNILNMDIFLIQMHQFSTGVLPCEAHIIMDAHV